MPRLDEGKTGTFDASGRAVVTIGPLTPSSRWRTSNVAVSSTSTVDTECRVYLGSEAPQNLLGGTFSGNRDSIGAAVTLYPGSVLSCVWINGTPGATAAVSVYGVLDVDQGARGRA
jgi:hypothetical protein